MSLNIIYKEQIMSKKNANPVPGVENYNEEKECISHEKCASRQPFFLENEVILQFYPIK